MRHADKIIEAVRTRPFLYDQTLQTFKHIGMKNRNWMEVAKTVYGREDTATGQWRSIRPTSLKMQIFSQQGENTVEESPRRVRQAATQTPKLDGESQTVRLRNRDAVSYASHTPEGTGGLRSRGRRSHCQEFRREDRRLCQSQR